MTSAIEAIRGERPLPEAGEGVTLRVTNSALVKLQAEFGDDFVFQAYERVTKFDAKFIVAVFVAAAHKDGKPGLLKAEDVDHIPVDELGLAVLDALYLAVFGRRFEDQVRHAEIMRHKAQTDSPTPSPET